MYLGVAADIVVKLYESSMYEYEVENGSLVRAHGIEYSDLSVEIWKQGETTLTAHPVVPSEWIELGGGLYILKLPSTVFNKKGNMLVRITGDLFRDYEKELFVEPAPLAFTPMVDSCIVTGNVIDLGGNASGDRVIFSIVNVPSQAGDSLISSKPIHITTDPFGNFSAKLIRGSKVRVQIPSAGINIQIDVPDQANALLLDLMPSIP